MTMASPLSRRAHAETTYEWPVDPWTLCAAAALLVIGLVMVASASSEVSARTYDNSFYLFIKHGLYLAVSIFFAFATLSVPVHVWQKLDWVLLLVSTAMLVAVLVPGVGREVNGSTRWIPLGFFSLQGSEFVKLFAVIYVAGHLIRHKEAVQTNFVDFMKPLAVVAVLCTLLLMQPDFGAAVVIMGSVMGLVFLAGAPMRYFMPIIIICAVGAGLLAVLQPYRLERLTAFTDPWEHQFTGGYQLTQALIAFGRGEWFGLGIGNSIQKLFFLPEAHTDFLFSIIAEELGIVGAVLVIAIFSILILRGVWIGRIAEVRGLYFHAYLAYGVAASLGIQAAINIGVNIGLLPTKGLTLPLVSYGGNSLIVSCMLVAVLLRIEFECRRAAFVKSSVTARRGGKRGR